MPEQSSVILELRDAARVYRMGEVEVHALRKCSLDIVEGEFLVVVGPSGSGKSTLLNLIGGMDRPTSGSVRFRGRDLTRASDHELTLYRRNHVGFVFQLFNLVPTLTAQENVEVATELANAAGGAPLDAAEALGRVGLGDRLASFPSQLSGGQQQRVAIARALAKNPDILLCDEPTGALDSETSTQVLQLLWDLNRDLGKTVVIITHERAVTGIGHRVATIVDGEIAELEVNEERTPLAEVKW